MADEGTRFPPDARGEAKPSLCAFRRNIYLATAASGARGGDSNE